MSKLRSFFNALMILTLVFVALGSTSITAQAGNEQDELKADPRLLQMAEENPDATFMVIVQKDAKNKDLKDMEVEDEVLKGGGQVKKQLDLIVSFSAEMTGKELIKLARHPKVRWISVDAPMVSTAAGDPTVRDEFSSVSYSNNNGTQNWAGNWIETGDGSVSASSGYVKISSGTLRLSSINRTISRQADLSGVASATLSFLYKRSGMDNSSDYVAIQASANGGSTWSEMARFAGSGSDSSWQTASFDILSYAAANTQIRFATSSSLGSSDYLYVDNVQIEYSLAPTMPPPAGAVGTVYWVTNISDAGTGSLRQAITSANGHAGTDTIAFNISGAGPHTIQPASALPIITDPVIIDGTSEPDFAGSPIIELNGSAAGTGVNGLTIQAGNSVVRGLVINRFGGDGIRLDINDNNVITGNYIGTDTSGTLDRGNLGSGILLYYQSGSNTIGGTTTTDRNIISGNDYHGIFNQWSAANVIQGNIIGLDATGTAALPNGVSSQTTSGTGIYIMQADDNLIGGSLPGAGNVISGNLSNGLFVSNSNNTIVQGNLIGTNAAGTQARGNVRAGVFVSGGSGTRIGGTTSGERNVISGNLNDGIDFQSINGQIQGNYIGTDISGISSLPNAYVGIKLNGYAGNTLVGGTISGAGNLVANNLSGGIAVAGDTVTGNAILGNSVRSNNGLGLNLGYDGVTLNNGLVGSGANNGMDYPIITSASLNKCGLTVTGYVGSTANQSTFSNARVEFFKSDGDGSGYGEGQVFLGYTTTDSNGNFTFTGSLTASSLVAGDRLTATATDLGNNTSEFGPNYPLTTVSGTCAISRYTKVVRTDQLGGALQGQGITVAVLDSGISSHPDLQGRITANSNQTTEADPFDNYGHGTHVAGIIGGNGSSSGGLYAGVAPQVNLVNVKVSNGNGMTYASDFVDGLQWIYDNRTAYNIKVVNISMNSTIAEAYHTSPIDAAVEILWFNGIVVVVSAGNNGTSAGPSTLYPPANDPFVITVGAAEDYGTIDISDDTVAVFSSYGTTENGFAKPELVAPGRNIISLLSNTNSNGYINHPAHRLPNNNYFRMTGTSMSAPLVSGAVALLLQDEPNLTPDQVKYRLMGAANKNWSGYDASKAGAGYLDIYAAVNGTTTQSANTGTFASQMLSSGSEPITWSSVGWNSVGWNTVGWNTVGWNTVGWNTVGWNTVGWNTSLWDD